MPAVPFLLRCCLLLFYTTPSTSTPLSLLFLTFRKKRLLVRLSGGYEYCLNTVARAAMGLYDVTRRKTGQTRAQGHEMHWTRWRFQRLFETCETLYEKHSYRVGRGARLGGSRRQSPVRSHGGGSLVSIETNLYRVQQCVFDFNHFRSCNCLHCSCVLF